MRLKQRGFVKPLDNPAIGFPIVWPTLLRQKVLNETFKVLSLDMYLEPQKVPKGTSL